MQSREGGPFVVAAFGVDRTALESYYHDLGYRQASVAVVRRSRRPAARDRGCA